MQLMSSMAKRHVTAVSYTGCSYVCSFLRHATPAASRSLSSSPPLTGGPGLGQVRKQVRELGRAAAAGMATSAADHSERAIKMVGIAGSLRRAASNRGLIRAAQHMVQRDFPDVEFEVASIGNLPLFNEDLELAGAFPPAVEDFRNTVRSADAILIATPEYNYSVSGVLKNALDWGSRSPNVFDGKAAAIMGAGGYMGTARAQYHLRQISVFLNLKLLNKPEVFVNRFVQPSPFNEHGDLVGADVEKKVRALLEELRVHTLTNLAATKLVL